MFFLFHWILYNPLTLHKIVPGCPYLWFREDSHGGWKRLLTKLALNNLLFEGGLVPNSAAAVKDEIQDLIATCRAKGAEVPVLPTKPVSFTVLVKNLERLGLIAGSTPAPHEVPDHVPDELQADHINNVGFFNTICNYNKN